MHWCRLRYQVFRGFNTNDGHEGNPYLKHFLKRYFEMSSEGATSRNQSMTEVKAMMQAIADIAEDNYNMITESHKIVV